MRCINLHFTYLLTYFELPSVIWPEWLEHGKDILPMKKVAVIKVLDPVVELLRSCEMWIFVVIWLQASDPTQT